MPRTPSAKKQLRKAKAATARNRAQRSALRTAVKKVRVAPSKEAAEQALRTAESLLDRAGRKNLVHRNTAARTKSRLRAMLAAKA